MLASLDVELSYAAPEGPMGGFFLDVIIELLIRRIIRCFRTFGTGAWRTFEATITATDLDGGFSSVRIAQVTYSYQCGEAEYCGTDAKPFWYKSSAKAYLQWHNVGSKIAVRVNPKDPSRSIFRERYRAELALSET